MQGIKENGITENAAKEYVKIVLFPTFETYPMLVKSSEVAITIINIQLLFIKYKICKQIAGQKKEMGVLKF